MGMGGGGGEEWRRGEGWYDRAGEGDWSICSIRVLESAQNEDSVSIVSTVYTVEGGAWSRVDPE